MRQGIAAHPGLITLDCRCKSGCRSQFLPTFDGSETLLIRVFVRSSILPVGTRKWLSQSLKVVRMD